MTNRRLTLLLLLLFLASQVVIACNMPAPGRPTESGAGAIYTAAASTVQAELTEVSRPPVTQAPGTPQAPTPTGGGASPTTPPPVTVAPGNPTPVPCDRVRFVEDVTVPDDTEVAPGATFTKTWRLQNVGSCTWTTAYSLAVEGGDNLGAPPSTPITQDAVEPNETVDVSVTLKAPETLGTYRATFMLRNAAQQVFGTGDGNTPFWVQVRVVQNQGQVQPVDSGIVLDFIARASAAQWSSGQGASLNTTLQFGGEDNDSNGVAKLKENERMENGAQSGKVLLTIPKYADDGVIMGVFPAVAIRSGDTFRARLGFLTPGGTCGTGNVKFQLYYRETGEPQFLQEWDKACNSRLLPVEVSLSALRDKNIQFILVVRAAGSIDYDWAIWNSARIER